MIRWVRFAMFGISLALSMISPRAAFAAESYDNCTGTISSLPAVISTQGTWCLKASLATAIGSGSAISINTNNVTIDCNDFKLDGSAAGVGTVANGIVASNRLNATIRRCDIRGFLHGVYLTGSSGGGHAVEDNRLYGNRGIGLQVEGSGSVVRRNGVFSTGGSTTLTNAAYGIYTFDAVDVIDNTVAGVTATSGSDGSAYAIFLDSNPNGRIVGNGLRGMAKDGAGLVVGVFGTGTTHIEIRDNDLVADGAAGTIGVDCQNSSGAAKGNAINGFASGIVNCTDSGGNDVVP